MEERLTLFKKHYENLGTASNNAYNSYKKNGAQSYTIEQAQDTIETGSAEALREMSMAFFYQSGFYRRLNTYFATLLQYKYVLIPHIKDKSRSIADKKLSNRYYSAQNLIDKVPFAQMCAEFATKVLVEGAYYGIVLDVTDTGIIIQDLSFDYCRSRFKSKNNVDLVEFDLKYFDKIQNAEDKESALKIFPKYIQTAYKQYVNNGATNWVFLEEGAGIYLKLIEEKPFLVNTIPATISLQEYKEIERAKDESEIKKLLVQKIGMNGAELLFTLPEMEVMHKGAVNMMRSDPNVSVLTTYNDISIEDLGETASVAINNLEKIEALVYDEAGVSKQLFAASGNIALDKSITNDMSLMMVLAENISFLFSFIMTKHFGDNQISFKLRILPITYYNNSDYSENAFKLASSGYSFLLPALSVGITQTDLFDLKSLENDLLDLPSMLIPLKSSYTQSGGEGGTEALDDSEKTDKTIQNEETK